MELLGVLCGYLNQTPNLSLHWHPIRKEKPRPPPTFSPTPIFALHLFVEPPHQGKRKKIEAPKGGRPQLLALSFQTLGTPRLFQPPTTLWSRGLTHHLGVIYSDLGAVSNLTFSRALKSR